jgi:hypothetical protein
MLADIYSSLLSYGKADEIIFKSRPVIEQMQKNQAKYRGEEYISFDSPENITNIVTRLTNTYYYLNGRDTPAGAIENAIEDAKDLGIIKRNFKHG